MNNSGVSESTEIASQVSNTQHTSGVATRERNYVQTVQDIENRNIQDYIQIYCFHVAHGSSLNQQQHPVQDIENPNLEANHSVEKDPVSDAALPPAVSTNETNIAADDEDQTSKGKTNRSGSLSHRHQSMYRATIEGDWVAAEMLLEGDPKLGSDEISDDGDRALHVAASMKHKDFVLKLVERMTPSELEMLDGNGYTACCYAAISGVVEIAELIIKKHPNFATARDGENKTPLEKAALRGNGKMVSYLLKSTKLEDLSKDEWFDLLLGTIRLEMYGVASEILQRDEGLATMRNEEGTALHLLAGQRFFSHGYQRHNGVMRQDMRLLAKQLWTGIQKLGEASALELMKSPPILHDAAKVGNVELITMLTHTYPHLIWHTDTQGYTIFHIAVKYRHQNLFGLIKEIGARKDLIATSQDENGNNILHLAAELAPPHSMGIVKWQAFQMQREVLWFKSVEAIVPPLCLKMKNKDGHTPYELFVKEHKSLLENSTTWMRNIADSCMLIATLILTVVFGSAFAVPGGYDQNTGVPILFKSKWFTCFVVFEALTLLFSAWSILSFLRMIMLTFNEDNFGSLIPRLFIRGLITLACSVGGTTSAFLSAYFLVFVNERAGLVKSVIIFVYVVLVPPVCFKCIRFYLELQIHFPTKMTCVVRHTLVKRHAAAVAAIN
ncbi:hypothetical protein C2S53_020368 [Perilla frutescens var. hirtella]|uniref:PGG domain-containing protein n=1 Tax=Perilla frutescens var. hirtella TaxID=608512 RepID=A0AAD4JH43_PERFH|nr:hypothetical protein C2S53_020368 [Perilla frutescens var. hirtella]